MSEEIIEAPAEAEPNLAEKTNISAEDFAIQRLEQSRVDSEVVEPAEEEESEEVPESGEEAPAAETPDVLSQFNLDEMSEDEIKELSKALGSRAVDRFGELTKRAKGAEERLAQLEDSLKNNPLSPKEDVKNNPFSDINDINTLQEKANEINEVIEWAEDILFESDDYGPNAEVAEVEGKSMTKAEVRSALKNARKSRDSFLPSQLKKIQTLEHASKVKSDFGRKAIEEFDWLKDGGDETMRKRFMEIAGHPDLQKFYKSSPKIGARMPYILAHAADSMYNRKVIKDPVKKAKINPPSPLTTSAKSEKQESRSSKAIKDLGARFKSSGTNDDFIQMRTKQLASRLA